MKFTSVYTSLMVLWLCLASSAQSQSLDPNLDYYYAVLKAAALDDGTAGLCAIKAVQLKFTEQKVSPAAQAEVYAQLIDRAVKHLDDCVLYSVFDILYAQDSTFAWNQHLEQSVLALANHADPNVRAAVGRLLAHKDKVKYRNLALSMLKDPSELVHSRTIAELREWPDWQPIFRDYVKKYGTEADRAKSVAEAKKYLDTFEHPMYTR